MYNCRRKKYCCLNNNSNNSTNDIYENATNNLEDMIINSDNCECGYDKMPPIFPTNPVLGQSYVPIQIMNKVFNPNAGLKMGTIFPELVSPYAPCQSMEEIAFIKMANTIKKGCNKC